MAQNYIIRAATLNDAGAVAEIYNYYVRKTTVSLEYDEVSDEVMAVRMAGIIAQGFYYVAETLGGDVVGFTYAKPWHEREGFRMTYESSIYLSHARDVSIYRGLGRALYQHLIEQVAQSATVCVLLGVITSDNKTSMDFHQRMGFTQVAVLPQVAIKFARTMAIHYWAYYFNAENRE